MSPDFLCYSVACRDGVRFSYSLISQGPRAETAFAFSSPASAPQDISSRDAGPHHRLDHAPSAEDRQLHAGDDGLPDALFPRRPLLGRPARQGSGGGGRHRRQPHVHRARDLADARAWARRRSCRTPPAARITTRALLVFNQSQVAVGPRRRDLPGRRDAAARLVRVDARRRPADGAAGRGVPDLVHPGDGAAVRDGRDGRGAARHGQLQARDDRRDGDGHPQHGAGAVPDLRLGDGRAARRGGRGDLVARRGRGRRGLAGDSTSSSRARTCTSSRRSGSRSSRSGARC